MRLRLCVRMCGGRQMTRLKAAFGLRTEKELRAGTYKFDGKGELARHRFHLRVDSRRKGVLMIDASKLLFLNGTALDYVRGLLEGWDEARMAKYMLSRYRKLDEATARRHYNDLRSQLLGFLRGQADVIKQTPAETPTIGADDLPSPYRMDLALTYRCENSCAHCYNENRAVKELDLAGWLKVIDRTWEIGVPHIVFTGGEPTLSPHLRQLIARSEEHGQVTGLISNGRKLAKEGYLRDLIAAGLDHAQVTLLSYRQSVHDALCGSAGAWKQTVEGIKAAVKEDFYFATNTTILRENYEDLEETCRFLIGLGVKNIAFNGLIRSGKGKGARSIAYEELESLLVNIMAMTEEAGVKLTWYTPTPYCNFNPINLGLGIKQCTACSLNMAVEPDGTVLPCQSYYQSLGNILTDPWDRIWNHELCRRLRSRGYLPEKCRTCNLADVCGGGCPLAHEREDYLCLDRHSNM